MKNHLVSLKEKDSLQINLLKTLQSKKLINKFKNFYNKLERKRVLWLLNWKKRNKCSKSLRQFKTNTKLRNNHFWVLQQKSRMTLKISRQL